MGRCSPFLNWLGAVLKRSFATWHGHEGWLALSAYAATGVLALLNFGPSEKVIGEEAQAFISYAAIGWLALTLFVRTPFFLWNEAVSENNELQEIWDYEKVPRWPIAGPQALASECLLSS